MLVPQHVALPGQRLVALPATEVAAVPILAHRLRVLATENQLERKKEESGQFRIRWKLFQTGLLLPECFSLDPIPRLIIKENRFENDASLPRQFFLFSFWQRLNDNLSLRIRIRARRREARRSFSIFFNTISCVARYTISKIRSSHSIVFFTACVFVSPNYHRKVPRNLSLSFFFSRRRSVLRTRCFDRFAGNMYLG